MEVVDDVVEVVDDVVEVVGEVVEVDVDELCVPVVVEVTVEVDDVPVSSVLGEGVSPQPIKRDRMEKYIMG